jgi:hypothetical protein
MAVRICVGANTDSPGRVGTGHFGVLPPTSLANVHFRRVRSHPGSARTGRLSLDSCVLMRPVGTTAPREVVGDRQDRVGVRPRKDWRGREIEKNAKGKRRWDSEARSADCGCGRSVARLSDPWQWVLRFNRPSGAAVTGGIELGRRGGGGSRKSMPGDPACIPQIASDTICARRCAPWPRGMRRCRLPATRSQSGGLGSDRIRRAARDAAAFDRLMSPRIVTRGP